MSSAPTARDVLDAAIEWHLQLANGDGNTDAFNAWLRDPEHARVWAQLQTINQRVSRLGREGRVAIESAGRERRSTLRNSVLGLFFALGTLLIIADKQWPVRYALADITTATGEYRELRLDDGSHVALDARSAIDIEFSRKQRRVILKAGQLLVESAHGDKRPFIVATDEGELRALGTRFLVRRDDNGLTRLTVLAAAVEATAYDGEKRVLRAGEDVVLDSIGMKSNSRAAPGADAWTHHMLAVENAPLSQVVAELSRHTHSHIAVDEAIADLPVTGTFPLRDINMTLAALTSTLPIVQQRNTAWWIRLAARSQN